MTKRESIGVAEILKSLHSIIQLLTDEEQFELQENMVVRRFNKNDVIYSVGDVPQYFHCLISGKVKVYKEGLTSRQQIVRVIKPIEFFAYRAYFSNQNYITAASAFETSVIVLIPMDIVDKWTRQNNRLARYFITLLSVELGNSDQRTVNLTQKHIRGRLAEALLFLVDAYGFEEDRQTLSVCLLREDLANLSNMTTSNAIRTLSAFAREGIVSIDGKKIKIVNEDELKRISKIG